MCGGGGKGSSGGSGPFGGYAAGLPPAQQNFTQASPEAMGWYRNAMDSAQQAASQPYQRFGTQASDFVAQLNAQQQAAQQGLQGQAEATAPYAQMGAGMQAASGMGNAAQMAGAYMNPFMQQVVSPVQQALQQQQGQQLAQQQADAIRGGAFGGERSGLQRATLQGQQELAMGQALSPLYQTGYGQALGAAQTDLQRQLAAGQGLSQAGLAAQQASLGAGTLGQQTQQAGITALQNQFNTAQMFPYMQAQFLSGIAGGLGPIMGQTSTQTQAQNPFGMFLASGGVAKDHSRMGGAVRDGGDYERGGYVRGGVSYGDDIGLSSQEQMYNDMESAEKGTQMPTGEIHAAQGLKPADFGALPQKKSTLDGLKGIAGLAKTGLDIGNGLGLDKLFSGDAAAADTGMSGTVGAAGDMIVPTFGKAAEGAAAEAAGGSGILEGLGGALSGAATTAAEYLPLILAPIGLKDGGEVRPHYEDGGVSSDDPVWGRMLGQESGNKQFDRSGNPLTSPAGAIGIAQVMPGTAPEAAKLAGLPFDPVKYRTDKTYNEALGRAYYNQQLKKFGTPEKAAAAYNAGPGRLQQAISRAGEGGDYRSFLPAETQKYLSNVIGGAPIAKEGLRSAIAGLQEDRSKIPMGDPRRRFMATTVPPSSTAPTSPDASGVVPRTRGLLPEKDESLADYVTDKSFALPALAGLASGISGMLGSKSRYLGTGIAQGIASGIGEGAKSAVEMPKNLAETENIKQQAIERAALAKRQEAETTNVLAGLYEKTFIPGRGLAIYDKSNPYKGLVYVTDTKGNPLPGKENLAKTAETLPTSSETPASQETTQVDEGGIPKNGKPFEWRPTTEVPKDYMPENQFQLMLPENSQRSQADGLEMKKQYQDDAKKASSQLMRISEMEHVVNSLNDGSEELLKTGQWGSARLNIAKSLNQLVGLWGGEPPFDPRMVSDAEILNKDAFRLGSEAGSALGSNEAGHIITASVGATPGIESSKEGYVRLLAGMKMAAEYQRDKAKFIDNYYAKFLNTVGAPQLFDQMNPPENYVRRAVASTIDRQALADLKKHGPNNMREHIDRRYGTGTTDLLMGVKQ